MTKNNLLFDVVVILGKEEESWSPKIIFAKGKCVRMSVAETMVGEIWMFVT